MTNANAVVSTLAGAALSSGSNNGTGTGALFNSPKGITTDGINLYVADSSNHTIRQIVIATGAVTTLAGTALTLGAIDGSGTSARFWSPWGITTDGTRLLIGDSAGGTLRVMQ